MFIERKLAEKFESDLGRIFRRWRECHPNVVSVYCRNKTPQGEGEMVETYHKEGLARAKMSYTKPSTECSKHFGLCPLVCHFSSPPSTMVLGWRNDVRMAHAIAYRIIPPPHLLSNKKKTLPTPGPVPRKQNVMFYYRAGAGGAQLICVDLSLCFCCCCTTK